MFELLTSQMYYEIEVLDNQEVANDINLNSK